MIKSVHTDKAPKAIGPYSQAVRAGQFLFVSGMLPLDPVSGEMVGTDVRDQSKQVFRNIEAILRDQGLSFDQVVKCEVFLKNMADFQVLNEVYAEKFTGSVKPARQTIEAAALPKGSLVEISCIAFFG